MKKIKSFQFWRNTVKNSYRITHLDKSSPRGKRNCGLKYIFITLNTLLLALFIALPAANGQDSSSFETLQGQPDEIMTLKHGRQSRNPAPTSEHLPDGKIAAVSEMIQTSPAAGELDSAFNPTFDRFSGLAYVVAVQPDGKIIVGGYFKSLNGNAHSGIVRFNPDGSFDNAFNPNINDTVFG